MSKVVKGLGIAALAFFAPLALAAFAPALLTAGVISTLNYIGFSAIFSGIAAQLASSKKPPAPSQTINYSGTVESRRIIYGEARVGGMEVIPPVTSGTNNRMLHQVLAIAGHEVTAIPTVYFNQDAVGSIGSITGTANDGLVSSGAYANRAWIRRYLGTSTQTADFILDSALSIWTIDHRGQGVAYAAIQFQYDDAVYKSGRPQPNFLVQGKKVYDPRKDSTNGGAGLHRLNNPATWQYSNNPALCLADYITDASLGMGEDQARIDWAMVATAAAECEEQVSIPGGGTQNRYTFNGVLYAAAAYEDNINALVGAMLGICIYSGGRWRISAGSWPLTTEFQITEATLVDEGVDVVTAIPYNERYNSVRGSFIDPNNNFQANEFPATSSATYVAADGETVWRDIRLEHCTNVFEAQRSAVILARKSRNRMSATFRCNMAAWRIRPGEVGIVSIAELGWVNKYVRCEGWKFNPAGYVEISVREENAADWTDPLVTDYTAPLNIANPTPVAFTPDPVGSLTATGTQSGVQLTWTLPSLFLPGAVVEVFEHTAASPFTSAVRVAEVAGNSVVVPRLDTSPRYYWVRVRMPDGTTSTVYPALNGLIGSIASRLDFPFAVSGNVQAADAGALKVGGADAWDSQIYSMQSFRGGAYVSFRPTATNQDYMVGLNTDPTTSADYSSIDYALYPTSSGTLQVYESGTLAGTFGSYSAGDDLAVVYDGVVVRYMRNGTVLRETLAGAGRTFYLDSSMRTPGSSLSNLRFAPYTGFLPEPLIARGNCQATDDNVWKSGGSAAWDSDVLSARGYGNCFVTFKANQTNKAIMAGLNTDPMTDSNFTSLDYAFYLRQDGNVELYESGSAVLFHGAYTTKTVFAITYDGGTVRYYIDGALVRSQTPGAGTFYFDSSFYDPSGGINSVRFGPGTTVPSIDTAQITAGAATDVAQAYVSSVTTTTPGGVYETVASINGSAFTQDVTLVVTAFFSAYVTSAGNTGSANLRRLVAGTSPAGSIAESVDIWSSSSSEPQRVALHYAYSLTAGNAWEVRLETLKQNTGSTVWSAVRLQVEVVKK